MRTFLLGLVLSMVSGCAGGTTTNDTPPAPTSPPSTPSPDGGPPPLVCSAGTADCNGIASDGCETDLTSDFANCGACGTSCGTASCTAGACGPERVAGVAQTTWFAMDADHVYFTKLIDQVDRCRLVRVAKDGSTSDDLYSFGINGYEYCDGIAVDDARVYFGAVSGKMRSVGKTPGANQLPLVELATPVLPNGLAVDSSNVWIVASDGSIGYVPLNLASYHAVSPANTSRLNVPALDATALYTGAASPNGLLRLPKAQPVAQAFAPASAPVAWISVQADTAFYATSTSITGVHVPDGIATPLVTGMKSITSIAADDKVVFASTSKGEILQIPRDGSPPITLANIFDAACTKTCTDPDNNTFPCDGNGNACNPTHVTQIAFDATHVYFADTALGLLGAIWRVPRRPQ
jgi:hypothetical protein